MSKSITASDIFVVLSKDNQRKIIEALTNHERSVLELCNILKLNQPHVSKYLSVLKDVNLVQYRKEGQQRFYRLVPETIKLVYDWVAPFEIFWAEELIKLEVQLQNKK